VVECDLAKVEVAGSNPVSRSSLHVQEPSLTRGLFAFEPDEPSPRWTFFRAQANLNIRARYPSGKGEVCKKPDRGGFYGESIT
jgi:hypothetical protein